MYSREEIEENAVLIALSGSRAYGTNTENSDYDYKGICIFPLDHYLSLNIFEQKNQGWETETSKYYPFLTKDTVVYDIQKFAKLLYTQNPNILEILWVDKYCFKHKAVEPFFEIREKLFSKKVLESYLEYSHSQHKRMTSHRDWSVNPRKKPNPKDYGMDSPLSKEKLQTFCEFLYAVVSNQIQYLQPSEEFAELLSKFDWKHLFKNTSFPEDYLPFIAEITKTEKNFISFIQRSKQYYADQKQYKNYLFWLENRNSERKAIEEKCGYDGKNASHCLRLLYQCKQIITEGKITVNCKEWPEEYYNNVIAARLGKLEYKELNRLASSLRVEILQLPCNLPKTVNFQLLNDTVIKCIHARNF